MGIKRTQAQKTVPPNERKGQFDVWVIVKLEFLDQSLGLNEGYHHVITASSAASGQIRFDCTSIECGHNHARQVKLDKDRSRDCRVKQEWMQTSDKGVELTAIKLVRDDQHENDDSV